MAYEELTELLENHKKELAHRIALAIAGNNPERVEQVASGLDYNITALITYLRSGELQPYKQLVSNYYKELLARNTPVANVQKASDIFFTETRTLIAKEFSGQKQSKLREAAIRRIEGVEQMQLVTLYAASILSSKNQSDQQQ